MGSRDLNWYCRKCLALPSAFFGAHSSGILGTSLHPRPHQAKFTQKRSRLRIRQPLTWSLLGPADGMAGLVPRKKRGRPGLHQALQPSLCQDAPSRDAPQLTLLAPSSYDLAGFSTHKLKAISNHSTQLLLNMCDETRFFPSTSPAPQSAGNERAHQASSSRTRCLPLSGNSSGFL